MHQLGTYISRLSRGLGKRWGFTETGSTSPTNGGADKKPGLTKTGQSVSMPTMLEAGLDKEFEKQDVLYPSQGFSSKVWEVLGFLGWFLLATGEVLQIPVLWFVFWEYVCGLGDAATRRDTQHMAAHKALPLWLLWCLEVYYYRRAYRKKAPRSLVSIQLHAEVFILVAVMMTLCANFSSLIHTPGPRLFDVGFLIIPEQSRDSVWRPMSDILTVALPVLALIRSFFLDRKTRSKNLVDWFRLISIVYLFRCLCVTLTSLPGPAPHCETYEGYNPPKNWHDIATRLGPMVGDFKTCGDLIFSGHTAWTTVTMLLLVRSFRKSRIAVYKLVKLMGVAYLMAMCTFAIAGRKHYTVDITLGILVASLTFFRFQDGWQWQLPEDAYTYKYTVARKNTLDVYDEPLKHSHHLGLDSSIV